MSNLSQIDRVVRRHDWVSLGEWVSTLDRLADLSDGELEQLERMGAGDGKRRCLPE